MTCNMVRLLCYHLSLFVTRMSMLERLSYCLIPVGVVIEKTSFTELTLSQTYCSTDKKRSEVWYSTSCRGRSYLIESEI